MRTQLPRTIQKIRKTHANACWAIDQWLIDVCGVSSPKPSNKELYHKTYLLFKTVTINHAPYTPDMYDIFTVYHALTKFKPDLLRKITKLIRKFPRVSAEQGLRGLKNVRLACNYGIGLDGAIYSNGKMIEYNHITLKLEFNIYHIWK